MEARAVRVWQLDPSRQAKLSWQSGPCPAWRPLDAGFATTASPTPPLPTTGKEHNFEHDLTAIQRNIIG